ncbi:hypothetical protein CQA66_07990 [Helicobacter aurati]|uniref:Thioredoxin domain-containing protein n=1 Tax=Helicobacter aurati TaxID=137778 RepID=A0A3D8J1B5_9HELI|nr:hypothetical protein [Helicobacter aurati]RDU70644.1 hypothetical protein CQA66_07990 [Helicobacter aurati]
MRAYFCLLLVLALLAVGCSHQEEDSENIQQESYQFENLHTKQFLNIILEKQESTLFPLKILLQDSTNQMFADKVILLATLPPECTFCLPVLTHLNNLASRLQSLQVVVLSTEYINAKFYQDLLGSKDLHFRFLVSSETTLFSLLDSFKRELNIEIKDIKSPFFLLIDKELQVIKSYEGPILEEVLDSDITSLLSETQHVADRDVSNHKQN